LDIILIFPAFGNNNIVTFEFQLFTYLFNEVIFLRDVTFGIKANVSSFWGTWGVSLSRFVCKLMLCVIDC